MSQLGEALARATDTRAADVGRGALKRSGNVITAALFSGPIKIVADENTWAVAGPQVSDSLAAAGARLADPLIFPAAPTLYASYDNCLTIKDSLDDAAPVALGAGTINDLVKLAAFELGRDYAVTGRVSCLA